MSTLGYAYSNHTIIPTDRHRKKKTNNNEKPHTSRLGFGICTLFTQCDVKTTTSVYFGVRYHTNAAMYKHEYLGANVFIYIQICFFFVLFLLSICHWTFAIIIFLLLYYFAVLPKTYKIPFIFENNTFFLQQIVCVPRLEV